MDTTPKRSLTMLFDIAEFLVFLPIVFGLCWFATHRHLRGVGAELYSEWLAGEVAALLD